VAADRFRKLEGIDYRQGAIEYPRKLDSANLYHLYTKPFYNLANKISRWEGNGLDDDTHRHFCDFANIALALALPAGARVLDAGCGSGWLCEYFSRLGYDCTGIDISPDLIDIANQRLASVPYGADQHTPLKYRLLVHDIESEPLPETFDAILCYDSLHHFENEQAVLTNIAAMLDYGSQLFVLEGERPPEGSSTEDELRNVMKQYATLESPYSAGYLRQLLREHGFAIVGDYVGLNRLIERERVDGERIRYLDGLAFHYLLAKKVSEGGRPVTMADSREPNSLRAQFRLGSDWSSSATPQSVLKAEIEVVNTGDTIWLVSEAPMRGTVRVALQILNDRQEVVAEVHGQPKFTSAVAPGESVSFMISQAAPDKAGSYTLKLDLIDQDICWFQECGTEPLLLSFEVREK